MKQFNLEEYLNDPTQRVVTRDGIPVRIICTDAPKKNYPVVGFVDDRVYTWAANGQYRPIYGSAHEEYDLFFADREPELTEFEKAVQNKLSNTFDIDDVKRIAKELLESARKDLQPEFERQIDAAYETQDEVVYHNGFEDGYHNGFEDGYHNGFEDGKAANLSMIDMPKWKKAKYDLTVDKFRPVMIYDHVQESGRITLTSKIPAGEYYIDGLKELLKLPKEDE